MEAAATHTAPLIHAPTSAVRRLRWAWPVAIVLGIPIGGYAASLIVGKVDSFGPALAGGLIAGAIIGAAQWWALRSLVPWVWIVATSVGMAAGLTAGAALVDYGISRGDLALMGAVTGLGVAALQAFVLPFARRSSGALLWVAVNVPAWALAWVVTTFVITENVKEHFAVFGASGALVFALLTWLVLAFLFRPEQHSVRRVRKETS
jgi:hypothetical protein